MKVSESQLIGLIKECFKEVVQEWAEPDSEDMSVTSVVVRETPDSYYDFDATLGNGWYSINGSYNGEVIYDNFIMGNGGHGQQISLTSEVLDWLDANITPQLERRINEKINSGDVYETDYPQ